jgi:hypothetical protein
MLASRERQRVVIRPLAGARGYRKVQSSKDVGMRSDLPGVWGEESPRLRKTGGASRSVRSGHIFRTALMAIARRSLVPAEREALCSVR